MGRIFYAIFGVMFLVIAGLTVFTDFTPQPTGVMMAYLITAWLFFDKAINEK